MGRTVPGISGKSSTASCQQRYRRCELLLHFRELSAYVHEPFHMRLDLKPFEPDLEQRILLAVWIVNILQYTRVEALTEVEGRDMEAGQEGQDGRASLFV